MDGTYHIAFVGDGPAPIADLYDRCLDFGLDTTSDGGTDTVETYSLGIEHHHDVRPETVIEAVEEASSGKISFWTADGMRIKVGTSDLEAPNMEPWLGGTHIDVDPDEFDRSRDDSVWQARIERIVDLVVALEPIVEPDFVWSACLQTELAGVPEVPSESPPFDHVDRLSWITVLGPDLVEEVGGRDNVLDTPAVETRVLDTGSILLVLADHPVQPETDHVAAATAHLLEDERFEDGGG